MFNFKFIELETQQLETIEGQIPTITIEKENGLLESFFANCDDSKSDETMPLSDYEWVTEYYSSKSSNIKGLTISVIIGFILLCRSGSFRGVLNTLIRALLN